MNGLFSYVVRQWRSGSITGKALSLAVGHGPTWWGVVVHRRGKGCSYRDLVRVVAHLDIELPLAPACPANWLARPVTVAEWERLPRELALAVLWRDHRLLVLEQRAGKVPVRKS